jgi:citrate lyase subunit beta/citryl-CoA lyase
MGMIRAPDLRRSLLFVAGADGAAHTQALQSQPDVLVQDLEDFTPQQSKQAAREMSADLFARARARGIIPAVRVNLLSGLGMIDLAAVVPARPELILLPKAESSRQIVALAQEIERIEAAQGLSVGKIEIVPTAETALGVVNLKEIVQASPRVKSCVLGAEDLAADLVAVRTSQADELAYARSRFLLECRALGIEPIDPPYTYSDIEGCERESHRSRQLGYRSKSAVTAAHINIIHRVFTPSPEEIDHAGRLVAAFEGARAKGQDRALVDGLWIEPPAYLNAQRLLERARRLDAINRAPTE